MTLQDDWLRSYAAETARPRPHRACTTMAVNYALMERYPVFRNLLSALDRETSARMRETSLVAEPPVTIAVVVHVLWKDATENISDAQVASQIAVLNRDYAATNPDRSGIPPVWAGLSVDSGLRFALAKTDPQGRPHGGILRVETHVAEFSTDDAMKSAATGGSDAWPAETYLNLWVCNLGGGILGYAQFPGGPPATDGVVIGHRYFGTEGTAAAPFDLGRTTTHEVGHWLNLRHIWGDTEDCSGSDFVNDTPTQRLPNFGTPAFPSVSCTNGPNGDMFMNYMDYVDDRAMFMFTSGQVARMRAALASIRSGLAAGAGL